MENNINHQNAIVALDIGTTKVCAVVGVVNEHGQLDILGFGKVQSEGVLRGVVSNIDKTVSAISEAIRLAQRQSGLNFKEVHVGIAGQHIKSLQHRGMVMRDNDLTEISRRDIERLVNDMYKLVLPPGDKILHAIPQEFTVDHEQGIRDPIGMSGIRLEANFHIITGQITATKNIHRCVERSGLRVANLTLEPIASATAVLSQEEKEAGVALVDIGGGTTDLTIFKDGIIRHTAVIPFGGNVVTTDIKEGLKVMEHHAEKLKVKYGSAMADEVFDNRIIAVPGLRGQKPKEVSEKNLAHVIQARMEEILDYIVWEIQRSGFEHKLIAGIVLTGGGALLKDIDKLTAQHTGHNARVGIPVEHLAHGYHEELSSPIYATSIGLLLKGFDDIAQGKVIVSPQEDKQPEAQAEPATAETAEATATSGTGGWLEAIFRKTKEWFEDEPDTNL